MKVYMSPSEAVLHTIVRLIAYGQWVSPRNKLTYEFTDEMFQVVNPISGPIVSKCPERNEVMARYLKEEVALYDAGEDRAEVFAERASLWRAVQNPDGTVNSCYGKLIFFDLEARDSYEDPTRLFSQWEWAKKQLESDGDSRQAFIHINNGSHQWLGNRDLPCTMHLNFHIRGGCLNLCAVMRSCDVTRGLPYDMPYFILLQERMLSELAAKYPGIKMGIYTHFAHSLHLYASEVSKARRMIGD